MATPDNAKDPTPNLQSTNSNEHDAASGIDHFVNIEAAGEVVHEPGDATGGMNRGHAQPFVQEHPEGFDREETTAQADDELFESEDAETSRAAGNEEQEPNPADPDGHDSVDIVVDDGQLQVDGEIPEQTSYPTLPRFPTYEDPDCYKTPEA